MPQILVTTDLSQNSKAGMQFAIQMARATGASLIFLHVYQVLRATSWSDLQYQNFIDLTRTNLTEDMDNFLNDLFTELNETPAQYQSILHHSLDTVAGIISIAQQNTCDYICISTKGAGMIRKFVGTNTGKLIVNSPIPVLCIPSNKQVQPIHRILYASDMTNKIAELNQVIKFAKPIKAEIDMLHFYLHQDLASSESAINAELKDTLDYPVNVLLEQRRIDKSMIEELDVAVEKYRPDMLIMFTKQNRSFFERVFLSSNTEAYSFRTQIPMLTFNK